jgi:hypothetical protein
MLFAPGFAIWILYDAAEICSRHITKPEARMTAPGPFVRAKKM